MQEQAPFLLGNISAKAFWGFHQKPSKKLDAILPISDHEVVFVVGSRLAILDHVDGNKSQLIYFGPKKVAEILFLSLSSDLKFLAASIRIQGSNATMLIHQIDKQGVSDYRTPRMLQHNASKRYDGIFFSADSELIAAFTDDRSHNILIYDRVKEILIRSLEIGSPVTVVSFNPDDSSKICTTGALLQFWRYTPKAIHNAPIAGLLNRSYIYTCHTWLRDRRVVVGTDTGELVVVNQSSVQSTHHAFGSADNYTYLTEGKVVAVLADENHVIAASSFNSIGVFEILALGTGIGAVSSLSCHPALLIKAKFKLGSGFTEMRGIQLNIKSHPRSVSKLLAVTQNSIYSFELSGEYAQDHTDAAAPFLALRSASIRPTSPMPTTRLVAVVEPEWVDLPGKPIYCFHSDRIDTLCLSTRSSSFVTASEKDGTVRVWDITKPFSSPDVTEDYVDRRKDMPCRIDMHPSGWTVVCANKEGVVGEYAVTLSGLMPMRQIVAIKIPFVSSDGTSYALNSLVSIVKFSNGGHLLAVVCGKLIQLFHMYDLDYSRNDLSGRPKRVMTIAGHGSTISDLVFSADDCRIFSCSVDGTVYSHAVNLIPSAEVVPFTGEYFTRGAAAIKIVTNLKGVIIVCYDSRTSIGGHLAIWHSGDLSDSPMIVQLDVSVREIALGRTQSTSGDMSQDICMMGAADGSILVSVFPLPTVTTISNPLTQASCSLGFLDEFAPSLGNVGDQYSVPSISSGQSRSSVLSRRGSSPMSSGAPKVLFSGDMQVKETATYLDCSRCKIFHLHCGSVTSVAISADGNRMFSSGEDGAVFMLSASRPSKAKVGDADEETVVAASIEMQSEPLRGNSLMLADKRSFEALRSHTVDIRSVMEEKLRDTEKAFSKLSEQSDLKVKELEARLKREVSKRDAIILNERENHQKQKSELTGEILNFEQKQSEIVTRVELGYEQRLAQEALYLDRMRQAYEEMAIHNQLDKRKTKDSVSELHLKDQNEATVNGKIDAAKQKESLLTYVGYVSARHDEILSSFEKGQEKERMTHKKEFAALSQLLEESKLEAAKRETVTNRLASQWSNEMAAKEDHLLRMKDNLDWAEGRAERLEVALQQATSELKKRTEMYEKWEFKAGDQQQQISEMEKIRKALTAQIHALRQEIGPKEEKLSLISGKLQEMDREYDMALRAVSDREQALNQKSVSLSMLQKQVRDLRLASTNKDASLRRAAVLFEQYRLTLEAAGGVTAHSQTLSSSLDTRRTSSARRASLPLKTSSLKRNQGSAVCSPNTSEDDVAGMSENIIVFQRLRDVLRPHLTRNGNGEPNIDLDVGGSDSVVAYMEKEKQVKQLHKNVSALKVNLEKAHTVFELKAKNQLNDNEHLLKEVNDMRHEVRKLSLDNLRLKADLYEATRKRNPRVALSSTLPLGMRSKETYDTAARSHFEGGGEDCSFDKLNEFPDSTKSSPSTREGGDSDFRSKYGDISDNSDSVELSSIAPTSANEKISKIVFPNEKVIRSERIARDKRLLSDGSCVAQDILTFHQQRGRGETGSPSYLTPESDINIASPGKHSASLQTNLTLHTNNLHLPAVMKQSTRVGK